MGFCLFVCLLELNQKDFNLPARPYESCKIFKGWAPRDAASKLVQLWYKTFPADQRGHVEMNKPTRFSNETSTA